MGGRSRALLVVVVILSSVAARPAYAADPTLPDGFRIAERTQLGEGLKHLTLVRDEPAQRAHVAYLQKGSSFTLRTVLSNDAVAGASPQVERTSEMCRRARCLAGINGDFYAWVGYPIGGLVSGGALLRSPNSRHHQLSITPEGALHAGPLSWTGSLVATDLKPLSIHGVNVERRANNLILYTPAFGPTTETNDFGVEILLDVMQPAQDLLLGQTALVQMTGIRQASGDTRLAPGTAVLSGHGKGADALVDLWERVQSKKASSQALLRLESNPEVRESIGGTPILVREGKRWFSDENRSLYRGRHPRTMAGWDAAGNVFLVTVDGRQPGYSEGFTMVEAAAFMIGLGATDAINLDGGGSTTFTVRGAVVNRPSDRTVRRGGELAIVQAPRAGERVLGWIERPVATALVIVAAGGPHAAADDPLAAGPLDLPAPTTVPIPASPQTDPASNLAAGFPAIVAIADPDLADRSSTLVAIAALLVVALATATGLVVRRRRRA